MATVGASGGIAAVLGSYFVLYPTSLVIVILVRIPTRVFPGVWFLYQLVARLLAVARAPATSPPIRAADDRPGHIV